MSDPTPHPKREGYSVPLPAVVPRATFWPAAAALAVMLVAWGLVTSPVILVVGGVLLVTSIAGWIGEIRHERTQG